MMNANDVIESYVTDVALLLPRKQRNDVAFELRALLAEGLQDKADEAGRPADAAMAVEFLRAFGDPDDVAARYRPSLTIIEPSDGIRFLRLSVIGLLVIWGAGLWVHFSKSTDSGWDLLSPLGRWWTSTVIPSLWWPGVLVAGFAGASWARRRRGSQASTWKPRATDRIQGGPVAVSMGLIGIVCGIAVMIEPRWVLDFFWGGNAAPAAYQALTYTESFRQVQGPVLLVLVALNIPLLLAVLMQGRWSPMLRRLELVGSLVTCAAMAWTVMAGPMMMTEASDKTARFLIALITVFTLLHFVIRHYRTVRPMANAQLHVG